MEIHIVSDWQDEHIHVMFAGIDITFPWYDPVEKLVQLLAFIIDDSSQIFITTGNKYYGATSSKCIQEQYVWGSFSSKVEIALTNKFFIEHLQTDTKLFGELSYNLAIKRNGITIQNSDCYIALRYTVYTSTVVLNPLFGGVPPIRANTVASVNCRNMAILLKHAHSAENEYFYFSEAVVVTANLCEISYDTLFKHQGVKLCS